MQWDLFRVLCQHYQYQRDLFKRLCQHHQYQRDMLKTALKIHQATSTKFSKVSYHQNYNQGYINTKDKRSFTNMVLHILKGPVIFNFISKGLVIFNFISKGPVLENEDQSYLYKQISHTCASQISILSTNKCNVLLKFLFLTFKILKLF